MCAHVSEVKHIYYYGGGEALPGKAREFDVGRGKVREIVVCLFTTVAIVTK